MRRGLITVLAAMLLCTVAHGADRVVVESRSVPAGASNVEVGVYIENDATLSAVVLPLEFRSVTAGSFIADTLLVSAANRLTTHLNEFVVVNYFPTQDNTYAWRCGGGGYNLRANPDFQSPDALLYAGVVRGEAYFLPAGNDGAPPTGSPSLLLNFGVTGVAGTFEIDTTCASPGNHLAFVDSGLTIVAATPSFTKGVIEIGCECDCHTDPQCNGYHNIIDWILIRDVANGTHQPMPDPNSMCPVVTTDVNCDGVTTSADRDLMYGVLFCGWVADSVFCHPCP